MKKMLFVLMLMGVFTLLPVSGSFVSNGYAAGSALGQAQSIERNSSGAAHSGSAESARERAGRGFDTPSGSPPVVDLTGKKGVVDPKDLKKDDPKPRKLQKVVPPLP